MTTYFLEQKKELRRKCKLIRNSISDSEIQSASEMICNQIGNWTNFIASDVVLTYISFRSEVNLSSLISQYPKKKWVIPRINEIDHSMKFYNFEPNKLIRHSLGMLEPSETSEEVTDNDIQLVLVPGLAFDQHGGRLGYGGGYYDRFLAGLSGVSLGVTYNCTLLEQIPKSEFDIPVNYLVTEKSLSKIENQSG